MFSVCIWLVNNSKGITIAPYSYIDLYLFIFHTLQMACTICTRGWVMPESWLVNKPNSIHSRRCMNTTDRQYAYLFRGCGWLMRSTVLHGGIQAIIRPPGTDTSVAVTASPKMVCPRWWDRSVSGSLTGTLLFLLSNADRFVVDCSRPHLHLA